MTYAFRTLTQEQAENIAFGWHYEEPYTFYDMEADEEDFHAFINPEERGNSAFAVTKDNELVAFLMVEQLDAPIVEIGLGMNPACTGKGKGLAFVDAALDFVKRTYKPQQITLSVALFNQRAIKVYRKAGFTGMTTFMQATNGGIYEFLKMIYVC